MSNDITAAGSLIQIISQSRQNALKKVNEEIQLFAKSEGLTAHANSIRVRFEKDEA